VKLALAVIKTAGVQQSSQMFNFSPAENFFLILACHWGLVWYMGSVNLLLRTSC